ncbi:MAG: hypothetical protein EZS28_031704, partial [Streblomastix strix]
MQKTTVEFKSTSYTRVSVLQQSQRKTDMLIEENQQVTRERAKKLQNRRTEFERVLDSLSGQSQKIKELKLESGRVEANGFSLQTVEGIEQQQRTEYLYLRENLLETIPPHISLKYVKIVDVSFNRLHSINFIGQMPLLRQLYARGNLIESLADIPLCPSLEYLVISMNPITSLVGLDQLPNLRSLIIEKCKIDSLQGLPEGVSTQLESIRLGGNPVSDENRFLNILLLVCLPDLRRINGVDVYEEEKKQANKFPQKLASCLRLGMKIDDVEEWEKKDYSTINKEA